MDNSSNPTELVCVTGATGFIAAHIIKLLLQEGYHVNATVRSLKDKEKYQFLVDFEPSGTEESKRKLKFFEANLTVDGSFDQALAGCTYVLHTASPYVLTVRDPQKDLVDPAVKGTLTVLQSCSKIDSVKKVVITSSVAAITDSPDPNHVYTEADWNKESTLSRNPYYYSKRLAEEAGWDYVKKNSPKFELVAVNPFLVIGPELSPTSVNTSNAIFQDLLSGKFPAIIALIWGVVDVRDVAKAHVLAMKNPKANGRYLLCAATKTMKEAVDVLKPKYPDYALPTSVMDGSLMTGFIKHIGSHFQPAGTGSYLRTNLGRALKFDNSKVKNDLGMEFIDPNQTFIDTCDDLVKRGLVKPKK